MEIKVLNPAGVVLFVRNDMEQGNWTQEEYTVNASFPFVPGKVLERGQRIAFRDPATGNMEIFELRNVTNTEPEHYQQIIGEHIAVSELSDEHINNAEITLKTATQALTQVLSGTLWAVGNVSISVKANVNISRGTVWQAVCAIAEAWNVYITPRITINTAGTITGRYLDATSADGVWRGVRLSIDKNMSDSSVVYDDSEVLTALYGYGGTVDRPIPGADDGEATLTFADVEWSATSSHPAKPAGQTYLEDPAKTALYGRNGRARFGFYQNGDVKNADVLLQLTWQALQQTSSPKISITGTVADLYRLGYADEPIRLHDIVIVDIPETGETFQLQIIKCDVDLLDPTGTRPEIGAYIPNIVYINRENDKTGGGGGGGRGQTPEEYNEATTFSAIEKTDNMIGLVVGTRNGDNYIKAGQIVLAINEDGGTTAKIEANVVDIAGVITAINNEQGTRLEISADQIDIDGLVTLLQAKSILVDSLETTNGAHIGGSLESGYINCSGITTNTGNITCDGTADITALKVADTAVSWQTYTARYVSLVSGTFTFVDKTGVDRTGRLVSSVSNTTLHYLGY